MPLSGTFDTIPLTEIVQWIFNAKKSGLLTISLDFGETYLSFRGGELTAIGSDDPLRLDLGPVVLQRGLATDEDIRQAMRKAGGRTLIETLVSSKALEQSAADDLQSEHVLQLVLDLFFYEEGSFHFSSLSGSQGLLAGDIVQLEVLTRPISIQHLLMETMQRLDEWNKIRQLLSDSLVVVESRVHKSEYRAVQELIRLGKSQSLGELCLRIGHSRFEIYQELFTAYHAGEVSLSPSPIGPARPHSLGSVDVLLESAKILLREEQFDEAREVLTTAQNLDPDSGKARALLRELRESQLQHLYEIIPPHRTPVLSISHDELAEIPLDPRETYLASRLNGRLDVASLVVSTPLGELDTLRTLRKLLHAGLAKFID